MSDCSTEAMMPKLGQCCPYCGQPTPFADGIRDRQRSIDKAIMEAAAKKDAAEQRCQQLEQVARDIFRRAYEFNRDGPTFGGIYIADFRERLEALGVSVDD